MQRSFHKLGAQRDKYNNWKQARNGSSVQARNPFGVCVGEHLGQIQCLRTLALVG